METNNRKQLVTQDNGNIEKIFPKNYMSNIVDEETGESLRIFLLKYNHIDLGYRSSKSSARLAVPIIMRRKGLYITYYLPDDVVITEFFNGNKTEVSDTNWIKDELWVKDVNELNVYDVKISDGSITLDKLSEEVMQLISSKGDITINNFPDNEDLELYTIYQDSNNKIDAIRFKDRDNSNGMAYKYLRKTKNMILSQSDFNQANAIYEIRYDFDLNGSTINIPENCELKFIGGSLKNGTINFNNTLLSGDIKIKTNILGNIRNNEVNVLWFNVTGDGNTDDRNAIQEVIDIVSENTTILFPKVNNFYNVIVAKGNGNTIIEQRANAVYSDSLYPLIVNKNNITIVIRGIIKSTNILGNMFEVSGNNVVIIGEDGKLQGIGGADDEGFLDTNTSDTTLQWHPCLIKINGDNCRINNLSFEDYPTHGIDCYGKALIVDSCLFIGGRIEHSTTGGTVLMGIRTNTGADSVIMKNNRFIANSKGGKCYSCMFPSGDKFIISNNICEKYHEHAVYAYGNYGSIIDNKFTDVDCIASDIQYFAIYGIIKGNFSIGTEGFIQIMHGKGTIVEGNTVTNCRGGIIVRPYHTVDVDKLPSGLKLLNNFIELTVGTTGSCLSFYVLGTYDISDILISGNTFANGYYTQASQVAASLLIGAGSSENNGIKFLRVENNVIRSGRGAVSWLKGIHNSIFKNNKFISESLNDVASAFSFAINANYVTDTIFEGNEFIDIKSTPTLARAIQLNTGTTNLSVINNNIINYTSNIYLDYDTDAKLIYKRNNRRNYLPLAGTYDNKPNAYAQEYGVGYYDKDNQVPMWWSGVRWKDAEGCYIVLSKSDINTPNKIYKIRFNIDLGGTTLTMPANCTLDFQGGSFSNGTIIGSSTKLSGNIKLDTTLTFSGTYLVDTVDVDWFYTNRGSNASPYIQAALDFAKLIKASVTFGNKLTSGYVIGTTLDCDVPIIGNNARLSSTTVGILNCKNECSIENLYIDFYPYQGASDVTDNKVIAINIGGETSTYNHYINNVTIDGFYYGIVMTNSWNLRCSNLRIIRTRVGIQAYGKCVNNSIVNANIDCKGTNSVCIAFNDEVDHASSTYLSEGWTISNSILTSAQYGIFGVNMSNTFISNCIIDLCSKNAIKFSLNSLNIRIVDNYLACLANGIDVINFTGQNVLNNEDAGIIISNNTIKSYYSDSGACNGINIGEGTYESIYILGNTISNLGGIGIVSLNGEITHINVSDNRFKINVGGYFYVLKATNKYIANNNAIDNYNNSGIKVANKMIIVANSAPTSNTKTWNAGDICLNSNASVGSIIGWFCATSGSPGTWFPIGTIEQYAGLKKQGTTAERPAMNQNYIGATYYDTTLEKMILWNGTAWTNVDGSALT